jgi:hypothetical protein
MDIEGYSTAIRVNGEVLLLHCWACCTPHYVDTGLFSRERFPTLICSNQDCRMSMFLLNELVFDSDIQEHMKKTEQHTSLAARSRFWK